MGKSTSINIRSLVIFHHEKGKTSEIGKIVKLPRSTIHLICNGYYKENRVENIPSTKGLRKIKDADVKFIVREIRQNPKLTATELTKMLFNFSGTKVHHITIRRILQNKGFSSCIARKKPLITKINRIKRLKFALQSIRIKPSSFGDKLYL